MITTTNRTNTDLRQASQIEAPELLEVVPWNYGYAHSWALCWLLEQPMLADRILGAIPGLDLPAPVRLEGSVRTEKPLAPARADLALELYDARGDQHRLAIETKVQDPIREGQLAAYQALGYRPILYLPGLTGLFAEGVPAVGELRLTGGTLASALAQSSLPHVIQSYVDAVEAEHHRMQQARASERVGSTNELPPGHTDEQPLRDVAWLVEVHRSLTHLGVPRGALHMRAERHDRGIYWPGVQTAPDSADIYIDVIATIQSSRRLIAVKTGNGTSHGRAHVFDQASTSGPPDTTNAWRHAARRTARNSSTIWSLELSGRRPDEVSAVATATRAWLESVAARTLDLPR
jgi:hypothetical protein